MNTNKSINAKVAVVAAVVVMFLANLACDDGPTPPCANACGVTSPVTQVEQAVMDAVQPDQDNTLSGGN